VIITYIHIILSKLRYISLIPFASPGDIKTGEDYTSKIILNLKTLDKHLRQWGNSLNNNESRTMVEIEVYYITDISNIYRQGADGLLALLAVGGKCISLLTGRDLSLLKGGVG